MRVIRLRSAWRIGHALTLGVLFFAASESTTLGQEVAIGLQCTVSCSVEEEGVAVAQLKWDTAEALRNQAHLDWTVYPDGFRNEAYASFSLLSVQREQQPSTASAAIPSLRPFQLRLDAQRAAGEELSSGTTVKNLEAGVNYSFRLAFERDGRRVFSETVTCQAPICIREEVR
jgi:hypothetical protein